jgi:hypothetical protein
MRLGSIRKFIIVVLLFGMIIGLQYEYDMSAKAFAAVSSSSSGLSPTMIRYFDMGFSPAIAAFLWAPTMPEILDLFRNRTEYFSDLDFLNGVDPRFGYPYAFSVLTLPATPYKDAVAESVKIGLEGLQNADPDWRIPYYMATNYYLDLKDEKDAIWYYDVAARTPGIPEYAESFSLNFSVGPNDRKKAEALWATIEDSSNDELTKERAQDYIDHLQDLDLIQEAAQAYKDHFGNYPTSTAELVQSGILPELPQDPFGFTFLINKDGTAGIDYKDLPAYLLAAPAE